MQFQADVLGVPVVVPEVAETTALGAALPGRRGRRAAGRSTRSRASWRERARYEPRDGRGRARRRCWTAGAARVERARGWARQRVTSVATDGAAEHDERGSRADEGAGLQGPAPGGVLRPLPRARAHARPDWVYEVVRGAHARCYAWIVLPRARRSPPRTCRASGPVILAPNHFSFMDHFFLGVLIRGARCASWPSRSCSQRADAVRSTRTAACSRCAAATATRRRSSPPHAILERGGAIAMYCEGGRSRTGKLAEQAKPGIGRLALETGAPIVPDRDPRLARRCATGSACSSRR